MREALLVELNDVDAEMGQTGRSIGGYSAIERCSVMRRWEVVFSLEQRRDALHMGVNVAFTIFPNCAHLGMDFLPKSGLP